MEGKAFTKSKFATRAFSHCAVTIRFSPKGVERYNGYEAHVNERIKKGWLTESEGVTLMVAFMQDEVAGAEPHRIKCPQCGAIEKFIGKGTVFFCACSPTAKRSIWDCRVKAPETPTRNRR